LEKTTKKATEREREREKMGLLYSSISDSHGFFFFFTKEGKIFLDEKRI
jgi:hypothetical protein